MQPLDLRPTRVIAFLSAQNATKSTRGRQLSALRHTFAFQLARVTNADAYELERRLGHRSQRYIAQ